MNENICPYLCPSSQALAEVKFKTRRGIHINFNKNIKQQSKNSQKLSIISLHSHHSKSFPFLFILSISKNHNKYIAPMEEQKNRLSNFNTEPNLPDTIPSFLLKTYEILENEKYQDIICWTRSGEGFIVKKVKEFADNVLPIYFRHSNYTSFVRQLNMYDFHKTRQENHENAFKNVMFKRGFKHLLKDIQRKDYKKNKENTKEAISNQKSSLDKVKDAVRNQKFNEGVNEGNQITINNLAQMNNDLQQKALVLASLKQMPQREIEVIRLLDLLFDAKKLQREMLQKLHSLESISLSRLKTTQVSPTQQYMVEKWESKLQWGTTDVKASSTEHGKQDKLGTYSTLFASFRLA